MVWCALRCPGCRRCAPPSSAGVSVRPAAPERCWSGAAACMRDGPTGASALSAAPHSRMTHVPRSPMVLPMQCVACAYSV